MERLLQLDLKQWKSKNDRKPLILQGARQIGKSWLLKRFGEEEFDNVYHLDFEKNKDIFERIFEGDIKPTDIINKISLFINKTINTSNDLIIFDEVQNIPRALTSLKYFCEDMPELAICAAGSLLGIFFSSESYPVGKVEYLTLYPMNFEEFLLNYGNKGLYKAYKENTIDAFIHQELIKILREYYVIGGMPEIVKYFFNNKDNNSDIFNIIRKKQTGLLLSYTRDFNKHSGKVNALHIERIFENIPMQLADNIDGSVKKYHFKNVIKNKKGYEQLQGPIDWLIKVGLVIKVHITNKAEVPFKFFAKDNLFKLYLFDIGILGAMLELPPASIILGDYAIAKGFFIENFVMQEIKVVSDKELYSWTERNSEIELLTELNGNITPIEVKSSLRTKAKSLTQFIRKYNPKQAVILSEKKLDNYKTIKYIPLYYANKATDI